jgi:hypothetical protein
MTTEPPFDHPADHTKYGPPPPDPPRQMPWMLTPGFKSSCALVCVALMLTCCTSAVVTGSVMHLAHLLESIAFHVGEIDRKLDNVTKHVDTIDNHVGQIDKKVDAVTIKPKEDEPKKDDAVKKDKEK